MPLGPEIATKYDLRVPRYTSYPTAPHFHEGIDGEAYANWLAQLDPATPLSLYFHIPFCDSMCWFCGCFTRIVKHYEPIKAYLDVLLDEISLVADKLPGRFRAQHLHWGGGSPTLLTGEDWLLTVERLRALFDIDETAEIAVEMDPRDTTEDYVKALAKAGVNRASIGVQDYHEDTQVAVNRIQPYEVTRTVIEWLRGHGIDDINMDLMYGLPYQTVDRVIDMVDKTVVLSPARIALFGYAHVPWMKAHQKKIDEAILPDAAARWAQSEAAAARLVENGYVRVGLDHFARADDSLVSSLQDGTLHRNFQGYTADAAPALIGLGASAIGSLPQGYVQNTLSLKEYRENIAEGRLPTKKGIAVSPEDLLRRRIVESLMCDLSVDLAKVCADTDFDPSDFAAERATLAPLVTDGIITMDGDAITVTEDGRPLIRLVAAAFDTYLNKGEKKHSRAV